MREYIEETAASGLHYRIHRMYMRHAYKRKTRSVEVRNMETEGKAPSLWNV